LSYIPNTDEDRRRMLDAIGVSGVDDLFATIPSPLRLNADLDIPARMDQITLTRHFTALAKKNAHADDYPCFLGAGVYDRHVPPTVGEFIRRSEFLTSYTPYQPEMSQGVLQAIFEFQTLITELVQMDVANASMYDGASAMAEAAIMAAEITGRSHIIVLDTVHPVWRQVLETYVYNMHLTIDVVGRKDGLCDLTSLDQLMTDETAAVIVQQPNFFGCLEDASELSRLTHANGSLLVACVEPVSLGMLTPPGAYGADIVVGEGQGLGVPMGFGGPLLGFFACKNEYIRRLPGRIVGQTTDADGKRAFVMTLRTREQDIRRERATSNICTNVALCALAGTVYMATMGKQGLRGVAELSLQKAHYAADRIALIPGYELAFPKTSFFQEFVVNCPGDPTVLNEKLFEAGIIGGLPLGPFYDDMPRSMLLAVTEQRTKEDIDRLVEVLALASNLCLEL
jgi:glycine dehydrogenase subunit 1